LLDRRLGDADTLIRLAGMETSSARGLTSDPVWRGASHLPLVGASFAEGSDVARVANVVAGRVLPPAFAAARTLDPDRLREPGGAINIALLQRARPDIDVATARAKAALDDISVPPRRRVIGPVRSARADLHDQVRDLATALVGVRRGLRVAPALLGNRHPRRYFVLIQQNGEARGTGGLPGGFAILTASHGRVQLASQGSNLDLHDGDLPPPVGVPADYIKRYAGLGSFRRWLNINISPDLPVVARVIADRWKRQSGQTVDAVVTMDAQALADVLRGSPPIQVAGAPPLTSDNLVDYLAIGQYRDFAKPTDRFGSADRSGERKEVLLAVAKAAADRLTGGQGSALDVLRGLANAVASGHVRMASADLTLSAFLNNAGVDGALPAGPAPVAYPIVFNSSGGKLEYFLDRSVRYEAGPCSGPRRRSTITFTMTNRAPAGLPIYMTNPYHLPGLGDADDRVTAVIYGTRGARLLHAELDGVRLGTDGAPFISEGSESGLPLWSTLVDLRSGVRRTLVLTLDEPTVAGGARVPEQPLARRLKTSVDVPAC
jgi:hypothetical protein